MKKLKFILLILISIFCLNSCLLTTAAAGTYLLGTMGTYYCAEYGCTRDRTEKDVDGLNIFTKNNPLKVKNYFESIKKRELIKIKVKGNNEVFTVTLPKNFILKKISDGYYLYDKEKQIGFPLGFRLDENENLMTGVIDGTNEYINKIGEHIYFSKSYPSEKDYVNRIGKDIYFTFGILSSTENEKKITNFLKELVKEW